MATTAPGPYYDPYDFEIDADPYPVWKRLRHEAPLYFNEAYEFFALSRYEDVEKGLVDWQTYSSAQGSVLEIIKAGVEMPPGLFIFEDPPEHDLHRGLLSRVFTPRRLAAIEPKVRAFAARTWTHWWARGASTSSRTSASRSPCAPSACCSGSPKRTSSRCRDHIDDGLRLDEGVMPEPNVSGPDTFASDYAAYIDWRAEHPTDDLITELLTSEFTDGDGVVRTLTRDELLGYIGLLAGAGNETTTRLIGWAAKLLAEHPEQRRALADDPSLIPNAIEECLRYEPPSPVQARVLTRGVEHHGQRIAAGSAVLLLNASANRDERQFADPDRFDVHRKIGRHLSFGYGLHFCLGAHLARLEGRIALEEVLRRFPDWEIDEANAVQARTSTVRGWETLPVRTS